MYVCVCVCVCTYIFILFFSSFSSPFFVVVVIRVSNYCV